MDALWLGWSIIIAWFILLVTAIIFLYRLAVIALEPSDERTIDNKLANIRQMAFPGWEVEFVDFSVLHFREGRPYLKVRVFYEGENGQRLAESTNYIDPLTHEPLFPAFTWDESVIYDPDFG